ncbi:MAG: methyl-accepting chemotaxis protein [Aquabacterium sp.]
MLSLFRKSEPVRADAANDEAAPGVVSRELIDELARQASVLGREAAEVRGAIDDANQAAAGQAQTLGVLARELGEVAQVQDGIAEQTRAGMSAVARARSAVEAVGSEVGTIVETLHQVSEAAGQITQIALQTRLVAFNASVEAKRAGEAGRGFGVVADAVKDLAAKVEASSKEIMGTVGNLDQRIAALAREIQRQPEGAQQGAVHGALGDMVQAVERIATAADQSHGLCAQLNQRMGGVEGEVRQATQALASTLKRTETFLGVSEHLIELTAACGVETEDTPFIRAAQEAAGRIAALLEGALRSGDSAESDLFDDRYVPIPDSNPQQHMTRFTVLADRLFPSVQESTLSFSSKIVFCIAADRNGYIACHNQKYNQSQRPGEVVWNTANCRNRRIFNDRTGLASGRNAKPFLLQTYRRDMGGGNFVLLKEAAAPITVGGRHWGGLRLAYRF